MTFQLDTSGHVQCPAPDQQPNESTGCWFWSDLSPFTQGYVEALFASICPEEDGSRELRTPRFDDLAPETLARIIADCEAWFTGWVQHPNNAAVRQSDAMEGNRFWLYRQTREMTQFPPLTVQLGDDGKVRFA